MSTLIKTTDSNGVRHIIFDRPARKNAFINEMYIEFEKQLIAADADTTIRAILLSGSDTCFTAGNDIEDFLKAPPVDENSPVFQLLRTLNKVKKPIIAAVNGVAVGIGTTMLLHCDLVYASDTAYFSTPFVNLGCTPEGGSSVLLTNLVGQRHAAELLLLCKPFNADKALQLGLINEVCTGNAMIKAIEAAEQLATKPLQAVIASKAIMKKGKIEEVDQALVEEAKLFCLHLQSDESQEQLSKFKKK
jgi:enoyl-CoA hydratase/carnithine racemase